MQLYIFAYMVGIHQFQRVERPVLVAENGEDSRLIAQGVEIEVRTIPLNGTQSCRHGANPQQEKRDAMLLPLAACGITSFPRCLVIRHALFRYANIMTVPA